MRRGDDVVELMVLAEEVAARGHQLIAHQHREAAADESGADREYEIKRPDVLVIGRHQPAREEPGRVRLVRDIGMSHRPFLAGTS
jgi:hypothetical protein